MATNPYQNLCGSLSQAAHNILYEIQNHPAASFVKASVIYNQEYKRVVNRCGNLYVARAKAALITLAAMDEVARVLRLMPATESTPLPELVLDDMLRSLGFAPDTQLVQKAVIHTRSDNGVRIKKSRKKAELVEKKTAIAAKVPSDTPMTPVTKVIPNHPSRFLESKPEVKRPADVNKAISDDFNSLMHNFSKPRKQNE
jgi:hypothetical protein